MGGQPCSTENLAEVHLGFEKGWRRVCCAPPPRRTARSATTQGLTGLAASCIRRRDALAKRERAEASAVRSRLEKASIGEGRAGLGSIAAMAAVDALASRSVMGTLDAGKGPARSGAQKINLPQMLDLRAPKSHQLFALWPAF